MNTKLSKHIAILSATPAKYVHTTSDSFITQDMTMVDERSHGLILGLQFYCFFYYKIAIAKYKGKQ
ncbi:MAG: hypothetical protein PUP91_34175 [Rhizonema sp. PD37]|nr:hypothetical protein [Rhizonema sp. PD37]